VGYGDDVFTERAAAAFSRLFGDDIFVRFVATGTAANVLAIAALTEPWQQVICHRHSHYNDDESTAPERITSCRTVGLETDASKLIVPDIERVGANARGDVHQPQPGVVTISNPTEFGTIYTPDEVRAICAAAHVAGYRVHMDGARFANAVAAIGCEPRELTVDAGLDAMSFGGTKNGLAAGEAVVFFRQGDDAAFTRASATFDFHRKSTGHLLSKHRFVSAPFVATLESGAWLRHAAHANAMAGALGAGLTKAGCAPAFPVEGNAVFVSLPPAVETALADAGHAYYHFGDADRWLARLMCSFDTTTEDVAGVVAVAEGVQPPVR